MNQFIWSNFWNKVDANKNIYPYLVNSIHIVCQLMDEAELLKAPAPKQILSDTLYVVNSILLGY